ncbi:MAG TPA: CAP domain-containing protein [Thermoanaerobaculia bacterium]|nr:CAP domain-containing protein [Thermoanaerobaculia bacterium]
MRTRSLLSVLALLLPLTAAAQTGDVRPELLRLINQERARVGAPPMRLSTPLGRAAQEHAGEIAGSGTFRLPGGSDKAMMARIERVGYEAAEWAENVTHTTAGPQELMRDWKREAPNSYRQLMDPAFVDLGIGVSRLKGMPLYTLLFAVPRGEQFARATAGLRDAERVRAAILREVNEVRRREGLRPLVLDPLLNQAAQKHAQDMLARSYFAHESPSGTTVRERSRAQGYAWRSIGENIAEGQTTVDEVMQTWMDSPGHRKNILSPKFTELGVGLVVGGRAGAYRVLWVQNFGSPR